MRAKPSASREGASRRLTSVVNPPSSTVSSSVAPLKSCTGASLPRGSPPGGSCGTKEPSLKVHSSWSKRSAELVSSSQTSTRSPARYACSMSLQAWRKRAPPPAAFRVWKRMSAMPARRLALRGAGAMDQEVRQQRRGAAGATLLGAGIPGRAGDVEVGPLHARGEASKEGAGRDGAAVAATHVGDVGKVAAQLLGVFLGERQLPGT